MSSSYFTVGGNAYNKKDGAYIPRTTHTVSGPMEKLLKLKDHIKHFPGRDAGENPVMSSNYEDPCSKGMNGLVSIVVRHEAMPWSLLARDPDFKINGETHAEIMSHRKERSQA